MSTKTRWLLKAPIGLIFLGFGLSIAMDASNRMARGEAWFLRGTIGLVILNAGLSVFGDAVKDRALLEWQRSTQAAKTTKEPLWNP